MAESDPRPGQTMAQAVQKQIMKKTAVSGPYKHMEDIAQYLLRVRVNWGAIMSKYILLQSGKVSVGWMEHWLIITHNNTTNVFALSQMYFSLPLNVKDNGSRRTGKKKFIVMFVRKMIIS